jgi:hypothetical protein
MLRLKGPAGKMLASAAFTAQLGNCAEIRRRGGFFRLNRLRRRTI